MFFDCFVYSPLKISISHLGEMIASKYVARANFIFQKNADDLAPNIFIRRGKSRGHVNTCYDFVAEHLSRFEVGCPAVRVVVISCHRSCVVDCEMGASLPEPVLKFEWDIYHV
jgi:hypothetical protein